MERLPNARIEHIFITITIDSQCFLYSSINSHRLPFYKYKNHSYLLRAWKSEHTQRPKISLVYVQWQIGIAFIHAHYSMEIYGPPMFCELFAYLFDNGQKLGMFPFILDNLWSYDARVCNSRLTASVFDKYLSIYYSWEYLKKKINKSKPNRQVSKKWQVWVSRFEMSVGRFLEQIKMRYAEILDSRKVAKSNLLKRDVQKFVDCDNTARKNLSTANFSRSQGYLEYRDR